MSENCELLSLICGSLAALTSGKPATKGLSIAGTILGIENVSCPGKITLCFPSKIIFAFPNGKTFVFVRTTLGLPTFIIFGFPAGIAFGLITLPIGTVYPFVSTTFGANVFGSGCSCCCLQEKRNNPHIKRTAKKKVLQVLVFVAKFFY